jgi:co-chaperonin GroES (HSP10)
MRKTTNTIIRALAATTLAATLAGGLAQTQAQEEPKLSGVVSLANKTEKNQAQTKPIELKPGQHGAVPEKEKFTVIILKGETTKEILEAIINSTNKELTVITENDLLGEKLGSQ